MIDRSTAEEQFARMGKLAYPPTTKSEVEETIAAIKSARNPEIARNAVSTWLRERSNFPAPADLYALINAANAADVESRPRSRCQYCGGSGFRTIWLLVTYDGQGHKRKRVERLEISTEEQANEFRSKLALPMRGDRQDVLSAAENCPCRNAA